MEFIENIYSIVPETVWEIISFVGTACAVLFLYFSSKYRNHELSVKWYILAFFFPFITSMVYLSKRKAYDRNIGMKVCPSCGNKCPPSYEICNRCLVELPGIDVKKSGLYKKLATVFLSLFIAVFLIDFVSGSVVVGKTVKEMINSFDEYDEYVDYGLGRISFLNDKGEEVYYDRNGEENYDTLDLPVYDREGNCYYFVYEGGEFCFYKDEGKNEWNEDNVLFARYCFVDEEGYFVYLDDPEPVKIIEEDKVIEYYFDTPYTDGKGNFYYPALEASWTPDGELITSREQIK